jgi:hypothetical protein
VCQARQTEVCRTFFTIGQAKVNAELKLRQTEVSSIFEKARGIAVALDRDARVEDGTARNVENGSGKRALSFAPDSTRRGYEARSRWD